MMRFAGALVLLLSAAAGAADGVSSTTVQAAGQLELQARLISLAQERLQSAGLLVDASRARMSLSERLPAGVDLFEVRSTWPEGVRQPPLPLAFMVRARTGTASAQRWFRVSLAIPVRRQVLVAGRTLPKGSSVGCADLTPEYRNLGEVPAGALSVPCELGPGVVVLRHMGRRDVVRGLDVGAAPAVAAGMPVAVTTRAGAISVTATGIAVNDAMVGDRVEVRLTGPSRTRHVRVTAAGAAKLEGID
ncbi:MAG TPA: flagellar basal body P-ring formation chaperone FlgA [Steroidobacteraceae bacterium]